MHIICMIKKIKKKNQQLIPEGNIRLSEEKRQGIPAKIPREDLTRKRDQIKLQDMQYQVIPTDTNVGH